MHHPAVLIGVLLSPRVPESKVLRRLERRLGEVDVGALRPRRRHSLLWVHASHVAVRFERNSKGLTKSQLLRLLGVGLRLHPSR